MGQLPGRPDLDQLRRIAKELHRAAAGGDPRSVQRLRAVSERTSLAAAQLALAREYGFGSWASLRAAVVDRRCGAATAPIADKHGKQAVYGAADLVSWAQRNGWSAGALPVGAVFSAQSFITAHLQRHWRNYRLSDSLTPTNGRVFLTRTQRPVAIACLGVGAPALVTLLEQLVILGVRSFIAIGPAPAVSSAVGCGDCVVIDSAVRDDGISDDYLAPAPYALADRGLTESLRRKADERGLEPRVGSTWTVPTPYRTTAEELTAYRGEGVLVTELTTASLFAVSLALGARAASAVVVTRDPSQRGAGAPAGPPQRTGKLFGLLEAAISVLHSEVTA